MSFLHPAAWFLLVTLPLLWWLHKETRRVVVWDVSHLPFWEDVLARRTQKKSHLRSPVFLVRLLLGLLIVLACAGPIPSGQDGERGDRVSVMGATYDAYTHTVTYRIANHTEDAHTVELSVAIDAKSPLVQSANVSPRAVQDVTFTLAQASGGTARLSMKVDNGSWNAQTAVDRVVGASARKQVLLIGPNDFLRAALRSLPYVELTEVATWQQANKSKSYDLYIQTTVEAIPSVPETANIWLLTYIKERVPEQQAAEPVHVLSPLLMKQLDAGQIDWRGFQPIQAPATALPLVQKGKKPLISALTGAAGKQLYMAQRWQNSDFPLQPSFPVFVENVVSWFFDMDEPGQFITKDEAPPLFNEETQGNLWRTIILLIIGGLLVLEWWLATPYSAETRTKLWKWVRLTGIGGVLLALVGVNVSFGQPRGATIFLLDRSLSMAPYQKEVDAYMQNMIKQKPSGDEVAVLSFGADTMVQMPMQRKREYLSHSLDLNPYFTNVEKAIATALPLFPENRERRLVIISDGHENAGELLTIVERMKREHIQTQWLQIGQKPAFDVQLRSLTMPQMTYEAERLAATVHIATTQDASGQFTLTEGARVVLQQSVQVVRGDNTFVFPLPAQERMGTHDYTGRITFTGDTVPQNNVRTVSTTQNRQAHVLIVGADEESGPLRKLVAAMGVHATSVPVQSMPHTLEQLAPYDAVFLVNASRYELPPGAEQALETTVRTQGTGLFVIGGNKSFALGGYKDSLLEKMLPVQATMKDNEKHPETALLLVLDTSGSMEEQSGSVKKIEMAKEAALQAIEALDPDDYAGVLAFSDGMEWIMPFGHVGNKVEAGKKIGQLRARGGTVIMPALADAIRVLEQSPARVKHIVLLTDGQGEPAGYEPYIERMKKGKITLSTAAIGQDAAKSMLQALAKQTDGRSYYVRDASSLPSIFAYEAYTATRRYVNNGVFTPQLVQTKPHFPAQAFPTLSGYTGTGAKEQAELLLRSDKGDPILATWRYGLGNVAVWTPDLNGGWSGNWLAWPLFQQQWTGLINWGLAHTENTAVRMQARQEGDHLRIDVAVAHSQEAPYVTATGPQGEAAITVQRVGDGGYSGTIPLAQPGHYSIAATVQQNGKPIGQTKTVFHHESVAEYDVIGAEQEQRWAAFEQAARVKRIDKQTNVFAEPLSRHVYKHPLADVLLPCLFVLFYIDIALCKPSWRIRTQERE